MSEKSSHASFGYAAILTCCVASAVSNVFIFNMNKSHNVMLSIAMIFAYATIIFTLLNIRNLPSFYRRYVNNLGTLFKMNVVTVFNWMGTFMALQYIDPASVACISLGLTAVANFVILTPLSRYKHQLHLLLCMVCILVSMALIVVQHTLAASEHLGPHVWRGIIWAVVGGLVGGYIGVFSEKLGQAEFSVTQILATRFQLLVLVGIVGLLTTHQQVAIHIDWRFYLLSSLIVVFLPLFMYQTAIKLLGSIQTALLEPFAPVITYFLQVIVFGQFIFNALSLILLVLLSGLIIWFVSIEQRLVRKRAASA
jgi:drug/metabolite transporter (DMT)-like permease